MDLEISKNPPEEERFWGAERTVVRAEDRKKRPEEDFTTENTEERQEIRRKNSPQRAQRAQRKGRRLEEETGGRVAPQRKDRRAGREFTTENTERRQKIRSERSSGRNKREVAVPLVSLYVFSPCLPFVPLRLCHELDERIW
ncbi:MAG: hypothetical protein AAF517_19505, partial [Planctomycetota bacterium]